MMIEMKKGILSLLDGKVDAIGFAPVDRFKDAPERHHPSSIYKDAKTVIVLGKALPRSILHSPDYSDYLLHRAYHTVYEYLNQQSLMLCTWIEAQGRYFSVQIPSVFPLVLSDNDAWGILSLKHPAIKAGLRAFGKNGPVHNSKYGTLLRFGAVVTSADLPADPAVDNDPCPDGAPRVNPPEAGKLVVPIT
jgi:epoxyqueuosine reductase